VSPPQREVPLCSLRIGASAFPGQSSTDIARVPWAGPASPIIGLLLRPGRPVHFDTRSTMAISISVAIRSYPAADGFTHQWSEIECKRRVTSLDARLKLTHGDT
jgi:hypothetical protein